MENGKEVERDWGSKRMRRKWGSMLGFGWRKLLLVRPQRAFSDVLGVWPFYQMQIGGGVSLF